MREIKAGQDLQSVTSDTIEERLNGQNAVAASLQFQLRDKMQAGTLSEADLLAIQAVIASLKQQNEVNCSASKLSAGFRSLEGARDAQGWRSVTAQLEQFVSRAEARQQAAELDSHRGVQDARRRGRAVRDDVGG